MSYRPPSCDLLKPAEDKPKLKECPVCGSEPDSTTIGSHIEIWCCIAMSVQKSDHLTIEERQKWDGEKHLYSEQAEQECWNLASSQWNSIPRRSEVKELLRLVEEVVEWGDLAQLRGDVDRLDKYADKLRKEWGL